MTWYAAQGRTNADWQKEVIYCGVVACFIQPVQEKHMGSTKELTKLIMKHQFKKV